MKMKSSLLFLSRTLGLAFLLFLTASNARATNLLTNPDFDTDINSWEYPDGYTGTYIVPNHDDTMDHDDTPVVAGSLRLQISTIGLGTNGVVQCVEVTAGATYVASAFILRETQTPKPSPYLNLTYRPNADCTGVPPAFGYDGIGLPLEIDDQWFEVSFETTVPQGALSAQVHLVSSGTDNDSTFTTVYFDHLYLPEPNQGALGGSALLTLLMLRSFHRGRRRKRAASALK